MIASLNKRIVSGRRTGKNSESQLELIDPEYTGKQPYVRHSKGFSGVARRF